MTRPEIIAGYILLGLVGMVGVQIVVSCLP
jgi:hypothetical protein